MEMKPKPSVLLLYACSTVVGICTSFILFTVAKYTPLNVFRGQLIAGDRAVNAQYPTTLNAFQHAIDVTASHTATLWWVSIFVVGVILSPFALRFLRRFV